MPCELYYLTPALQIRLLDNEEVREMRYLIVLLVVLVVSLIVLLISGFADSLQLKMSCFSIILRFINAL